jgi:signal transduction histidine kinase/CheY-like chemotaxis protein
LLSVGGRIFYETHFAPLLRMQGYVNEIAFDLSCKDGRLLPVLVNAVQKRDDSGEPIFDRITIFNASDRRRYERELLEARKRAEQAAGELQELNQTLEQRVAAEVAERMKAEAALRQAQKMEAIGQLTGGVAHDFNNLLTIVVGNIEILLRHLPSDAARLRRAADNALQGARRAAALTHRLLAFARQQPLDPKPIDANKLVFEMSELLRRTIGETISLETVLGGGLWRTQADPNQLENAILNLAVNARDAMPTGGRLTIETANAHLDTAYVNAIVEPVPPGQYIQISVTDTGTGIDQATMSRVFEPFFTTKEVGKGTGLGLSQIYGFVRQSGGHVRIYSEVGEGTTVKIYLPRHVGAPNELDAAEQASGPSLRGEGETILVVEDEQELRAYAVEALGELGYRVMTAADGPTAIALLSQDHQVDLLFTDVVLPNGMNGRQLADEAVKRRPQLKVLFTTGYTRNAVVHNGRLDADVNMIGKPFTFEELAASVRKLLDLQ